MKEERDNALGKVRPRDRMRTAAWQLLQHFLCFHVLSRDLRMVWRTLARRHDMPLHETTQHRLLRPSASRAARRAANKACL